MNTYEVISFARLRAKLRRQDELHRGLTAKLRRDNVNEACHPERPDVTPEEV